MSNHVLSTGDRAMAMFRFEPQWKEELVCTAPQGSLTLELTMGVLAAYLPTEAEWQKRAPGWARDLWSQLKDELEAWCQAHDARFIIDETAMVSE